MSYDAILRRLRGGDDLPALSSDLLVQWMGIEAGLLPEFSVTTGSICVSGIGQLRRIEWNCTVAATRIFVQATRLLIRYYADA